MHIEARHDGAIGFDLLHDCVHALSVVVGEVRTDRLRIVHAGLNSLVFLNIPTGGRVGAAKILVAARTGRDNAAAAAATALHRSCTRRVGLRTSADNLATVALVIRRATRVGHAVLGDPVDYVLRLPAVASERAHGSRCCSAVTGARQCKLRRVHPEARAVRSAHAVPHGSHGGVRVARATLALIEHGYGTGAVAAVGAPIIRLGGRRRGRGRGSISATVQPLAVDALLAVVQLGLRPR